MLMSIVSKRSTFFTLLFAHLIEQKINDKSLSIKMQIIADFKAKYHFTGEPPTDDELYSILLGYEELELLPPELKVNNPDSLYIRIAEISNLMKEKSDSIRGIATTLNIAVHDVEDIDDLKRIVKQESDKLKCLDQGIEASITRALS